MTYGVTIQTLDRLDGNGMTMLLVEATSPGAAESRARQIAEQQVPAARCWWTMRCPAPASCRGRSHLSRAEPSRPPRRVATADLNRSSRTLRLGSHLASPSDSSQIVGGTPSHQRGTRCGNS